MFSVTQLTHSVNTPESKNDILDILNNIKDILIKSYGPLGGNTIIRGNGSNPTISKDGFTILKNIRTQDPLTQDILMLVRSVANNLVKKVGDGSTSSIVTATELYRFISEVKSQYRSTVFLEKDLNQILPILEMIIKHHLSVDVNALSSDERFEVLKSIASVSNNNDRVIGHEVAKIMSKVNEVSTVVVKPSPRDNLDIPLFATEVSGFVVERMHALHPMFFAPNAYKDGIGMSSPVIITSYNLFEHHIAALNGIIENTPKNTQFLLIAENYSAEVEKYLIELLSKSTGANSLPKIIALRTGNLSQAKNLENLIELEAYIDSNTVMYDNLNDESDVSFEGISKIVGSAEYVKISPNGEVIFENGRGFVEKTISYTNAVTTLTNAFNNVPDRQVILKHDKRKALARLTGAKSVTIYVCGKTEDEKNARIFLVEDSVLACKSAIKNGITLGGNYASMYAVGILREYSSPVVTNLGKFSEEIHAKVFKLYNESKNTAALVNLIAALANAYKRVLTAQYTANGISKSIVDVIIEDEIFNDSEGSFQIHDILEDKIEALVDINGDLGTSIICPTSTDIEILRSAFSIVTLIITSNQHMV